MDRTNAKRQARHRENKIASGEHRRINYWVSSDVFDLISEYASATGITKLKALERMVMGYKSPSSGKTLKELIKKNPQG